MKSIIINTKKQKLQEKTFNSAEWRDYKMEKDLIFFP